jgi:hypothetical protein
MVGHSLKIFQAIVLLFYQAQTIVINIFFIAFAFKSHCDFCNAVDIKRALFSGMYIGHRYKVKPGTEPGESDLLVAWARQ